MAGRAVLHANLDDCSQLGTCAQLLDDTRDWDGLASPTKDLAMFLRLAARFPRHRFVLVPCWSYGAPAHLDELRQLNRDLGTPAEILPNLPHAEVMQIVRAAGIYLHTHALADDYGMPISIAEAMATGCHVIARRGPSTRAYLGDVGELYDSEDEAAALVGATECWDADRWRAVRLCAIDRAYGMFAADVVLGPLLAEWRNLSIALARTVVSVSALRT